MNSLCNIYLFNKFCSFTELMQVWLVLNLGPLIFQPPLPLCWDFRHAPPIVCRHVKKLLTSRHYLKSCNSAITAFILRTFCQFQFNRIENRKSSHLQAKLIFLINPQCICFLFPFLISLCQLKFLIRCFQGQWEVTSLPCP